MLRSSPWEAQRFGVSCRSTGIVALAQVALHMHCATSSGDLVPSFSEGSRSAVACSVKRMRLSGCLAPMAGDTAGVRSAPTLCIDLSKGDPLLTLSAAVPAPRDTDALGALSLRNLLVNLARVLTHLPADASTEQWRLHLRWRDAVFGGVVAAGLTEVVHWVRERGTDAMPTREALAQLWPCLSSVHASADGCCTASEACRFFARLDAIAAGDYRSWRVLPLADPAHDAELALVAKQWLWNPLTEAMGRHGCLLGEDRDALRHLLDIQGDTVKAVSLQALGHAGWLAVAASTGLLREGTAVLTRVEGVSVQGANETLYALESAPPAKSVVPMAPFTGTTEEVTERINELRV